MVFSMEINLGQFLDQKNDKKRTDFLMKILTETKINRKDWKWKAGYDIMSQDVKVYSAAKRGGG